MAEEKMKWVFAAGGLGFVAYALYQFLRETTGAVQAAGRPKAPWENV